VATAAGQRAAAPAKACLVEAEKRKNGESFERKFIYVCVCSFFKKNESFVGLGVRGVSYLFFFSL
jgi:hypothetical protein